LVLEMGLMDKARLDAALRPDVLTRPQAVPAPTTRE